MPLQRYTARPNSKRWWYRMKERKRLRATMEQHTATMRLAAALHLLEEDSFMEDAYLGAMLAAAEGIGETKRLLWRKSEAMRVTDFPEMRTVFDFPVEREFRHNFRFDLPGFWRVLRNFGWLDADEVPILITLGPKGSRWSARADWLLMVLCRRLSFPGRMEETCKTVGGSRTYVSQAWNFVLDFIFKKYRFMMSNIKRYAPWFAEMAAWLWERGCPHDNLVGFADGTDQFVCRSIGPKGGQRFNIYQRSNYSAKKKRHALVWQDVLLVNGLNSIWGPYAGRHHDAGIVDHTGLLDDLADVSKDLGVDYAVFGDAAYPLTRHCFPACKAPKGCKLATPQKNYNLIMSRFRTPVENNFAAEGQQWGFIQHVQNQKLGRSAVGKQYIARAFLHNCYTLLYDSITSVQHGGFVSENPITLEWFMDASN